MTEEKIIDGVDVSGCEFLTTGEFKNTITNEVEKQLVCGQENEFSDKAFTENAPNLHCGRCPDCFYKQLQRKTVECEYWKHQAELVSDTTDRLASQSDAKSDESVGLITKLQIATEALENYARTFNCTETDCAPCLISKTCAIHEIRQALERIKE